MEREDGGNTFFYFCQTQGVDDQFIYRGRTRRALDGEYQAISKIKPRRMFMMNESPPPFCALPTPELP